MATTSTTLRAGSGTKVSILDNRLTYYSDFMLVFQKQEIVFARTSPKHKLEIGESLSGHDYQSLMLMDVQ